MNELDTAIVLVTALSCIFGFWRGFVKEILALVTWIAALLIAWVGSDHLSGLMANIIENDSVRDISAFALIFIMVVLLGSVLSRVLAKLLTITGLRFIDSFLGGMFGIARGLIIVLVSMLISSIFISETEQWQQSILIPYGLPAVEWSRTLISDINNTNVE